jgi:hypothetical protein
VLSEGDEGDAGSKLQRKERERSSGKRKVGKNDVWSVWWLIYSV